MITTCAVAQIPAQDSRNADLPGTDTHFTMPAYRTRAEWELRKAHLRKQILFAAGLLPMPAKTPLQPHIFGRIENKDYSVEKVYLETMPGYYLGGNLYRPLGKTGKVPAVVAPHGHWSYGRLENQPLASHQARAVQLARQGMVVFSYDMVGYNDTMQTPHDFGDPREQLWGFGPLGLQLWNSIRVVDFLESLPEVDSAKIAATGESGGGTQVFLLTAVDARVQYSAPVNMISAIMQGGSPCENAPGLRVGAFNVEFGAMMAPRPMLMISATGDWTRNTPREEYPAIRAIYDLYDRPNDVETVQIDAPHNYNQASREAMYRFFGRRIQAAPESEVFKEQNTRIEKLQDLLVWHGRSLPENALTYERVREQWIRLAKEQSEAVRNREQTRESLSLALGADVSPKVLSAVAADRIVLSREGKGDRVAGLWIVNGPVVTVVTHPGGIAGALADARVKQAVAKGGSFLLIDAFQTGAAVAPRDPGNRHFLTFNKTESAERVQDILTVIAYLRQQGMAEIRLMGVDDASVWPLFAAAVSAKPVRLMTAVEGFGGTDDEFVRRFFVPGIQRAGGLRAARELAGF